MLTCPMTESEFAALSRVVGARSGIALDAVRKGVVESRLSRRVEELGLENFGQYLALLTTGPYQDEEFDELLSRLNMQETSFWRAPGQLDYFENVVLARLIAARNHIKRLRIWCAGCASGEEPYTIAIQVHRTLGVRLADWRIEILGTDVCEHPLLVAQAGRYTSFSFRSISPLLVKRYFREELGAFHLDPTIQSLVGFEQHDLREEIESRRHGVWDAIFCRNVLGFFDPDSRREALGMFRAQLAGEGALFISPGELAMLSAEQWAQGGLAPVEDPDAAALVPAGTSSEAFRLHR